MMSLPNLFFFFVAKPSKNLQTNVMKRYQTVTTFAHSKCFDYFVILSLGLSVQTVIFLTTVKRTSLLENKAIDTKPGTFH